MDICEGYACPPTTEVPAGEIVQTFTSSLGATGGDMNLVVTLTFIAVFMLAAGVILTFAARGKYKRLAESGDYGVRYEDHAY